MTAGKIAFITLNASTVRFAIITSTVELHTMSTTRTDRWPSNARIMASSLEWEVPKMSEHEIAGEILNLMNLLRCARCVLYLSPNGTLMMTILMITERYMPHGTGHYLEEVSVSAVSLCAGLQCKRISEVTRSVRPRNL